MAVGPSEAQYAFDGFGVNLSAIISANYQFELRFPKESHGVFVLAPILLRIGPELGFDFLWIASARWRRRLDILRQTVGGEPVFHWPKLLRKRWLERKRARITRTTE